MLEEGDMTLCTVDRIAGTVVFVKIEGEEREGSIILSEIAPGRIRNLRDYVIPKKKIENVTYSDFGDMVEKKIFGAVVWPYHPSDVFAIDELLAIPNPKVALGHPITLTAANIIFSEDLSSLKVTFNPDVSRSGAAKVEINTGRMSAASEEEEGDDDCRIGSAEELEAGLSATY